MQISGENVADRLGRECSAADKKRMPDIRSV